MLLIALASETIGFEEIVAGCRSLQLKLHLKRSRKYLRIVERRVIVDGVFVDRSEPLNDMQRIAVKMSSHIEDRFIVVVGHIHHEGIPLPMTSRIAHPR